MRGRGGWVEFGGDGGYVWCIQKGPTKIFDVFSTEGDGMSTEIEKFLYGQFGTHGVVEIGLSTKRLILSVVPWTHPSLVKVAEFMQSRISSIEVYADNPDDLNLPWDIIGFNSFPLSESRWTFVLHCAGIEYNFESRWPTLRTP
jgi:hypothetical protein